jgi:predicted nucleic acid-binding protein
MTFVLDASVALASVLGDERSAEADAALERLAAGRAVVPTLWVSEMANGLLAAQRRGRITKRDAALAIDLLDELPIEVDPESRDAIRRIHGWPTGLGLTVYDATYLELAIATDTPLAPLDDGLRRAARSRRIGLVP